MAERRGGDPRCVANKFKCQTARSPEGQGFAFPGAASRSRARLRVPGRGFAFPLRVSTRFCVARPFIATNARRLRKEAQGMPGARCTRSLACELKKHAS